MMLDNMNQEVEGARREAINNQKLVEPTEDEKKNGWTAKTLTAYHADRSAGQSLSIDVNSLSRRMARKPQTQARYQPLRWRE